MAARWNVGEGETSSSYMEEVHATIESGESSDEEMDRESEEEERVDRVEMEASYIEMAEAEDRLSTPSPQAGSGDHVAARRSRSPPWRSNPEPSTSGEVDARPLRRSRIPVWGSNPEPSTSSSGVVLVMGDAGEEVPMLDAVGTEEEFWAPDSHEVYEMRECKLLVRVIEDGMDGERESAERNASVMDTDERSERDSINELPRERVRAGRGRRFTGRGRASLGGRGGGRNRPGCQEAAWVVGDPLREIWLTDDDVPFGIRTSAMDVMRRREKRAQERRARAIRSARERRRVSGETTSERETEDDYEDTTDGLLSDESLRFEWSPMETFNSTEELFTPQHTGSVECHQTPYDAFRSFWNDGILEHIVDQTNRHAERITSEDFRQHWTPTNVHEVICLLAFWNSLGIVRLPTLKSCFSTSKVLKTEVFRRLFTYRRYILLSRALHFSEDQSANSGNDRLYLIRPIITHLNESFKANYIPSKDVCIDESLTLWKGRLNIKQYFRSKVAKFGIKTFELCDSATGYLWSFIVYTGKQCSLDLPQDPTVLKSTFIVKNLIEPLLNKGHRLFMDNWYNSPYLARFLKRNGTDCVGTLRPNRQDVPFIVTKAPLKQGQLIARHSGDVCVLSWQDKKRITMISTCHGSASGLAEVASKPGTRPLPFKPQVVLDYNKSMGGVDLKDQMLEPYLLERKKCSRWYNKLFKRLVDVSILNARILLESSLQRRIDHLDFRLQLVDAIMTRHLPHVPQPRSYFRASAPHDPRPTTNSHWPVLIEKSSLQRTTNRYSQLRCVQCSRENKESRTAIMCESCKIPLCMLGCFKKFHTG